MKLKLEGPFIFRLLILQLEKFIVYFLSKLRNIASYVNFLKAKGEMKFCFQETTNFLRTKPVFPSGILQRNEEGQDKTPSLGGRTSVFSIHKLSKGLFGWKSL